MGTSTPITTHADKPFPLSFALPLPPSPLCHMCFPSPSSISQIATAIPIIIHSDKISLDFSSSSLPPSLSLTCHHNICPPVSLISLTEFLFQSNNYQIIIESRVYIKSPVYSHTPGGCIVVCIHPISTHSN